MSVVAFEPALEHERYVFAPELAEIMSVSQRQIVKWTAEGMPSETWGLRKRVYLPSACIRWARERAPV